MPEGPECRVTADQLTQLYAGKQLIQVQWDMKSAHFRDNSAQYQMLLAYLPATLIKVYTHAKKIIFLLQSNQGGVQSAYVYLVSFMGMTGNWKQTPPNNNIRFMLTFAVPPEATATSSGTTAAYYMDNTAGGRMNVAFSDAELTNILSSMGPDLLEFAISKSGAATYENWYHTLKLPRLGNMLICDFLLEQKYYSGIGNYLRAEILYYTHINPFRQIHTLSDTDIYNLWYVSLYIIKYSYDLGGHTHENPNSNDYFDLLGSSGKYVAMVYKKQFDPQGNQIRTDTVGKNRTIHWVPAMQY